MVRHVDVPSGLEYGQLVAAFEKKLGVWPATTAQALVARQATWDEVATAVAPIAGDVGLMIIAALDQGALTSLSGHAKHGRLYLVGNPLIATHILDVDPHGAFYVPFRVCLYDRGEADGARICYDEPSSFLEELGQPELTSIGLDLDGKIKRVVASIVRPV